MSDYLNGSNPDKWYIFREGDGWFVTPPRWTENRYVRCPAKFSSGVEALATFDRNGRWPWTFDIGDERGWWR